MAGTGKDSATALACVRARTHLKAFSTSGVHCFARYIPVGCGTPSSAVLREEDALERGAALLPPLGAGAPRRVPAFAGTFCFVEGLMEAAEMPMPPISMVASGRSRYRERCGRGTGRAGRYRGA